MAVRKYFLRRVSAQAIACSSEAGHIMKPASTPMCLRAAEHLEEEEVVYVGDPARSLFQRFSEDYQGKRHNTECRLVFTEMLPSADHVLILNFLYTFVPEDFLEAWRNRKPFGEVMPRVPGAKARWRLHRSEIAAKRAAAVGKPRNRSGEHDLHRHTV